MKIRDTHQVLIFSIFHGCSGYFQHFPIILIILIQMKILKFFHILIRHPWYRPAGILAKCQLRTITGRKKVGSQIRIQRRKRLSQIAGVLHPPVGHFEDVFRIHPPLFLCSMPGYRRICSVLFRRCNRQQRAVMVFPGPKLQILFFLFLPIFTIQHSFSSTHSFSKLCCYKGGPPYGYLHYLVTARCTFVIAPC